MKYRHHSTIEKKPSTIIHAVIQRSKSLQTTVDQLQQKNEQPRKISVVNIPKQSIRKKDSITESQCETERRSSVHTNIPVKYNFMRILRK